MWSVIPAFHAGSNAQSLMHPAKIVKWISLRVKSSELRAAKLFQPNYDGCSEVVPMATPTNQKARYNSTIDKCEVKDRTALIEYRAKRDEWLRWHELDKDEPNSIQQQLFSMHFL